MEHAQTERLELASLLSENKDDIERRWLKMVGQRLDRHGMSETELRDSIPDYLLAIARALKEKTTDALAQTGTEAWSAVARQHAVTRIHLGFDVDGVVQEFLVLRRVIMDVLSKHVELSPTQAERIYDLIEGALRASVKSYVDHRDYQSRRDEARHIGFITHELRNPLSIAMAAAGQIRKLSAAGKDFSRHLELLEKSQKRIRGLIEESLMAQRLEVGEVEYHPVHVRLGDIIEESIKGAEQTAKRKGVHFETTYDPNILLHADPKLAVSALQNLVDNAAKFTDRGRVLLKVDDDPTEVIVHVFDECEGLSAEELNTIFEPFKRGHSGKAGTGLGLAIARRAVEAHQKTIHAESTARDGCHFWFALPKASH